MATREEIDRAAAGPVVDYGAGERGSVTGAGYSRTGQDTPGAPKGEGDEFTTETGVVIPTGRDVPVQGPEVAGGSVRPPENARDDTSGGGRS